MNSRSLIGLVVCISILGCSSPPKKDVLEEKEEVRAPLKPAPLPSPKKN